MNMRINMNYVWVFYPNIIKFTNESELIDIIKQRFPNIFIPIGHNTKCADHV